MSATNYATRLRVSKSLDEAPLPETAEELAELLDVVTADTIETTVDAMLGEGFTLADDADEIDVEQIEKAEGARSAFDRLVDNAMASGAVTRPRAVVAVAKAHPHLAVRANEPTQRYGHKPESEAIAKREAEQSPDSPHEVSDRWRAEQRAHDAATAEFARRVRQMVQDTAATSRPLSAQQCTLAVSRSDPALYRMVRTMPSHD